MQTIKLEVSADAADEIRELLEGLGAEVQTGGQKRDFGLDGGTITLVATVASAISSMVGTALWAYVKIRTSQVVIVDGVELRGLRAKDAIGIIEASRQQDGN